jgi:hypothetical protein
MWGTGGIALSSIPLALVGGKWQFHALVALPPGKQPSAPTVQKGEWVPEAV